MRETHTVVQRVARAILLAETPCVLDITLYTLGVKGIVGTHGVDHLQVFTCVWYRIACRVAHLIFHTTLDDMLVFESQPRLKVVVLCLMAYHQFHAESMFPRQDSRMSQSVSASIAPEGRKLRAL